MKNGFAFCLLLGYNMRRLISKFIPNNIKQQIKQSNYYRHRTAIRLASSLKRIDLAAAEFAHVLHLSNHPPIEGKICLEIGAGWVLTHALVCYLLGAKRIIASDIIPWAQPDAISFALKDAIIPIANNILAPFSDYSLIRERFNKLLSFKKFNFDTLKKLGIEYKSPIDFAAEKVNVSVDFIYSFTVLELVPKDDVSALLNNLVESLNPGGAMIHCIHLEDLKDFYRSPFAFLSVTEKKYTRTPQSKRGNRIRRDEWEIIFHNLKGTNTDLLFSYSRLDKPLPKIIDPSITYSDENDLRTSHIGLYTRKSKR